MKMFKYYFTLGMKQYMFMVLDSTGTTYTSSFRVIVKEGVEGGRGRRETNVQATRTF